MAVSAAGAKGRRALPGIGSQPANGITAADLASAGLAASNTLVQAGAICRWHCCLSAHLIARDEQPIPLRRVAETEATVPDCAVYLGSVRIPATQ
jgi:hypothetical protein